MRSTLGARCHACVVSSAPVGIQDSNSALVRRSACKDVRQSALSARGLQKAKRAAESMWGGGGMQAGAVLDAGYLEEVEVLGVVLWCCMHAVLCVRAVVHATAGV